MTIDLIGNNEKIEFLKTRNTDIGKAEEVYLSQEEPTKTVSTYEEVQQIIFKMKNDQDNTTIKILKCGRFVNVICQVIYNFDRHAPKSC